MLFQGKKKIVHPLSLNQNEIKFPLMLTSLRPLRLLNKC